MAVSKEQIDEEIADLSRRYSAAQDAGDVQACRWYYNALLNLGARMMSDGRFYPPGEVMASTPMKAILFCGMVIMTLDMAEIATPVAVAVSEIQRDWIVGSLAAFHKVPTKEIGAIPASRYQLEV